MRFFIRRLYLVITKQAKSFSNFCWVSFLASHTEVWPSCFRVNTNCLTTCWARNCSSYKTFSFISRFSWPCRFFQNSLGNKFPLTTHTEVIFRVILITTASTSCQILLWRLCLNYTLAPTPFKILILAIRKKLPPTFITDIISQ